MKITGYSTYLYSMIGKQFGNLTVIESAKLPNGRSGWLCSCKCGGSKIASTHGLNRKDNTSCGCLRGTGGRIAKDLTGKVFGNLTVINRVGTSWKGQGSTTWTVRCICGIKKVAQRTNLINGKQTSCGCIVNRIKYTLIERLYNSAKYNSKDISRRNIPFTLTIDEFQNLIFSDCYYCGSKPLRLIKRAEEELMYGGIDRTNSKLGYLPSNCVPCCGHCNTMKLQLSYEDFIEKIHKIANKHPIFIQKQEPA